MLQNSLERLNDFERTKENETVANTCVPKSERGHVQKSGNATRIVLRKTKNVANLAVGRKLICFEREKLMLI